MPVDIELQEQQERDREACRKACSPNKKKSRTPTKVVIDKGEYWGRRKMIENDPPDPKYRKELPKRDKKK
jgi:hypothetical protein